MKPKKGTAAQTDADADADSVALRRASRAVAIQITIASSVLVIVVLIIAFAVLFEHLPPSRLFASNPPHETTVDVGGLDIVFAGLLIGAVAILLAGSFSVFATRRAVRPLGDALRLQRAFVADASHELRTPLAVLDARLQLLQRGLTPDDTVAPIVTELRRDAKALIDIVNDLLAAAEVNTKESSRPSEVNSVVALTVDSMRILATDKNVTILISDTVQMWTLVQPASLQRCLVALLDNALDFSPPGSTITVSLAEKKHMVRIAVRDQGSGIHGIESDRVFDRFARSSTGVNEEGSARSGFGIGLALVRDTVERVGGRASVFSTSDAGTEIEILIPLAR